MALFKCKMCGGTLEVTGESVATCEYCGTQQTLPRLDDDRKANLYDRANHFRRNNEFDKAIGIYEQILNADTTDAESYWSLVLCRYGIEYVEDPATHKRVPTVNRAQFTSIFDDDNYKSALQYADVYQRHLYEEEAKAINEIQRGILEISQKEEPFDVFICYKETDAHGRRTQDSVLANDLYHQLTNEGFKVFFSRITLEDKLGIAYEPYIFAALNSAKVMVVLGTRAEHFNAVWVKNEWSRYLALIRGGAKKTLIPAYRDMDPYDLPEEFSHLQAQDMSKLGFMQDLIRGIKKLAQTDEPKLTTAQEVSAPVGNSAAVQLLKRGNMALEDGDWERADEFFEQALNADAELAEAYLGKFFAEQEVSNAEAFVSARLNAAKAVESMKREVSAVEERINAFVGSHVVKFYLSSEEIRACFKRFDKTYASTSAAKRRELNDAEELFKSNRLLLRAEQFGSLAVAQMKEQVLGGLQNLLDEARRLDADSVARIEDQFERFCAEQEALMAAEVTERKEKDYQAAAKNRAQGHYSAAIMQFDQLGDYKDSAMQAEKCFELKNAKERKIKNIKLSAAICVATIIVAFLVVIKIIIPSNQYKDAVALIEAEKYSEAIVAFENLDGYKDSVVKIEECNIAIYGKETWNHIKSINVGDTYLFGSYEQDDMKSNGAESIEWEVVDKEGARILLVSKNILDSVRYNSHYSFITWEACTLRKWLNDYFLNSAFSETEKALVSEVFLLNRTEVDRYLTSNRTRDGQATEYAKARGVYVEDNGNSLFWLRSPDGERSKAASYVNQYGTAFDNKMSVTYDGMGVRPAMWIDFSN